MNLVSTPSKWTCLVQWEYFNPKLPNSWHSSVPESPVWIIHWNLTLMNNSFPTFQQKHWFSIPNLPSPSFQPEGSSMVIDTVRSKAPMVSFTKISRWKAAWDWWILEGTLPYFRGLTNHGNQPLSNWDETPSIKSFMWFNVRMFRHQLNMVQSCSIHLQQVVMASYSITKNFSHVTLGFSSFCSVLGWHSPQASHDLHNRLMIGQTPSRSMNFQSPLRRWQESQWDLMGCTLWPSHPPG